ncbi:hypothetical protein [Streptomyces cinereospinus]|uniref:Polyketide synthase n=1 Tax=Streptomyces cinereospinus TaxID=285561 RepID=A0ABV5NB06_9ACTN
MAGAAPGTAVRISGWAAGDGARAGLLPVAGLDDTLTGTVADSPALFVVADVLLARLTAQPDPEPLARPVPVRVRDPCELHVRRSSGRTARFRFTAPPAGTSPASSWTVTAR